MRSKRLALAAPTNHEPYPLTGDRLGTNILARMLATTPVRRATRADEAYEVLRRMIICAELSPGAEFTELQAAELIGSGRTPVREALARLRHRRLIVLLSGRRYAVAPISVGDVRDLFEVRRLLESEATRAAAGRVDADQLRRLDAVCVAAYDPRDADSVSRFLQANTEFHMTVAQASRNPRIADLLAPILDEMERLLHLGLRESDRSGEIVHEHRRLIGALESGDPNAAVEETLTQLHDSQAMVVRAFVSGPSDGPARLLALE